MPEDNIVMCYEGIQRIYRNAVVRFLRSKMRKAFPQEWESKLRNPFQKEWETMKQNASVSRATGELTAQIHDDFDLLSVNHFFNLFDSYGVGGASRSGQCPSSGMANSYEAPVVKEENTGSD